MHIVFFLVTKMLLQGVPAVAQQVKDAALSLRWHRFHPQPGASGLRVLCCCSCDTGCSCSSIPDLKISTCCRAAKKEKKKKKKKNQKQKTTPKRNCDISKYKNIRELVVTSEKSFLKCYYTLQSTAQDETIFDAPGNDNRHGPCPWVVWNLPSPIPPR